MGESMLDSRILTMVNIGVCGRRWEQRPSVGGEFLLVRIQE